MRHFFMKSQTIVVDPSSLSSGPSPTAWLVHLVLAIFTCPTGLRLAHPAVMRGLTPRAVGDGVEECRE